MGKAEHALEGGLLPCIYFGELIKALYQEVWGVDPAFWCAFLSELLFLVDSSTEK